MRKRILVAALRLVLIVAAFTWIDERLSVALVFWRQTVPVSTWIMRIWLLVPAAHAGLTPMAMGILCTWTSAAVVGLAWIYGLARVLWLPLALPQRLHRLEWRFR